MSSTCSPVVASYAGAEALLDSRLFGHLLQTLSTQLPLRNLHWKPSAASITGPASSAAAQAAIPGAASIRTIQQLPLRLQPLTDELLRAKLKPETRHIVLRSLLERPFVHLYFVVCDDNEAYRTTVRNDIRIWISSIQSLPALLGSNSSNSASSVPSHARDSGTPGTPRSATPTLPVDPPGSAKPTEDRQPLGPEYLIVVLSPDGAAASGLAATASGVTRGTSPVPAAEPAPAKTGLAKVFGGSSTKANVVDKIKADFNSAKRERVVHLTRLPTPPAGPSSAAPAAHMTDPTLFADLLMRLKECASQTFDGLVAQQEEETRREWRNRDVPGWNYCKWVTNVECLANTFEGVGLFEEALARYNEIELVFQQLVAEHNLAFFSSTGGRTKGDDAALLLDTKKKPYHDLIMRNEITLFDFRCYVFARRAALLGKLGRVAQVMHETPRFLDSVGKMLREGDTLPQHFIEAWTFSSSLDVVEQCQAWLIERGDVSAPGMGEEDGGGDEGQLSAAFHAAKAGLLDLARMQLDVIGMAVGHLPHSPPFTRSHFPLKKERDLPALPQGAETSAKDGITRQELLQAIESRDVFDQHYIGLTERIISCWTSAGRKKAAVDLRAVLASISFYHARYEEALGLIINISEMLIADRAGPIEAHLLAKQLACHAKLDKPKDRAWVNVVVSLLKRLTDAQQGGVRGISPTAFETSSAETDESTQWSDEAMLYQQLRSAPFEKEVPISNFAALGVKAASEWAVQAHDEDGSQLMARVHSAASMPLEVDDVRMCLTSGERDQLWFTSGRQTLQPGTNEVRLACPSPAPGKYLLDVSQIRLARVIFQYASPKTLPGVVILGLPEDGVAFDARLAVPKVIRLDQARFADLLIESGRNEVERAEVRILLDADAQPLRGLAEARLLASSDAKSAASPQLEIADDGASLTLRGLAPATTYRLRFPLYETAAAARGVLPLALAIDYWSVRPRPTVRRQLRRQLDLTVALPLGVNVQDFFRADRLFSKFSITAGQSATLRMGRVELVHANAEPLDADEAQDAKPALKEAESAFEILAPTPKDLVIVSPRQPASYVFCLRRKEVDAPASSDAATRLRLVLRYRTLHDEARAVVARILDDVLAERSGAYISQSLRRSFECSLSRLIDARLDVNAYALVGQLSTGSFDEAIWLRACDRWGLKRGSEEATSAKDIIAETLRRAALCTPGDTPSRNVDDASWNLLSIPVDVPQIELVNAVSVDLVDQGPIIVGKPVEVAISITTSFGWGSLRRGAGGEAPEGAEQVPDDGVDFEDARSEVTGASNETPRGPLSPENAIIPLPVVGASASRSKRAKTQRMTYDVQADFETWLVSGAKRAAFEVDLPSGSSSGSSASSSKAATFKLTLIPLRHGSLILPAVSVWALPPAPKPDGELDQASDVHIEDRHVAVPSCATHQINAAQRVEVLPRAVPSTYWITLPSTETTWLQEPEVAR